MTQDEALAILKTGGNVFLTGEPGSGKTHTVNTYVAWLRERGIEPAITASTGIAATHIGGYTIHSWSGIGIKRFLSEEDLDQIAQNKGVFQRLSAARVLIIDEVSMLSARTLTMVEAVLRTVRRDDRPFGGLQVILVGDFFQLPPVERHEARAEDGGQTSVFSNGESRFAFSSPAWTRMQPLVCYLSEQHRQEDELFLGLLSALRRGELDDSHYALLETRHIPRPDDTVTELYSHNADVDTVNDIELGKLTGDTQPYRMDSRGAEKLVANLKRGCLSPEMLTLKVGARVMFTKNDHVTHKYVNGTLGTVTGFEEGTRFPVVKTLAGRYITAEPDEWRIDDGGKVLASITQVPLRLAWAMTVHKSQGMSLDAAHMDLSGAFEYGQGYVALSRVRTLAGLTLGGINNRALEVHPDILAVDAEFRASSQHAEDAFVAMARAALAAMQDNFVRACGGHEPEVEDEE